ncbi:MAG TPA: asparagine synthase-related protein [Verrucomicrobiae bacterium]|nr:asparagine synthase-related protein [Verrucomicrobiae bacterium]
MLIGELYGADGKGDSAGEFLADIARGRRPASELNGHLLVWAWDKKERQWHIWTGRFGTLHAYHATNGNSVALGTSFASVARVASRRQLDWAGLTGFFGCGFFPADRTHFEDVRVLQPASHYIFGANGEKKSAKRYWDWAHQPDAKRSYDDTVAEFADRFGCVMKEMLGEGRVAIPISGGLDSRSTVTAVGAGAPAERFWSYSYGYSDDSIETRISREVAVVRGLPFTAFTIKPYLFDRLPQVLAAVEGFQDITQSRQAFVSKELKEHADHVIAAHWGDVWFDDMGLCGETGATAPDEAAITAHTLKKMAKNGRGWLLDHVCRPQLGGSDPEGMLRQHTAEGLELLRSIEEPDFRVKAFKTDNWSFRWTLASIRMFQPAALPRLPFYDTRISDFFATVPTGFVAGRQLQVDFLKKFAPDLARVKWQVHDADLYNYQKSEAWKLPGRVLKKAGRILSGKKLIERNWEVQFGGERGERGLNEWLLRPGLRLHEFVPREKVQALLNDFNADSLKDARGNTVSVLLTFSAWLEQYG